MNYREMVITYRTEHNGGFVGNRETRHGRFRTVTLKTKKPPRPPHYPSESDWMVPNMRDPYAVHQSG